MTACPAAASATSPAAPAMRDTRPIWPDGCTRTASPVRSAAGDDGPFQAARLAAIHRPDRQPQRLIAQARRFGLHAVEQLDQRRPRVPRHRRRPLAHVVAVLRRDRDAGDVRQPQLRRELLEFVVDARERGLRVGDEIHLVDGEHDVADREQRREEAVAARRGRDPVAGVDHDDADVGDRRARREVARVVLVVGRFRDHELVAIGGRAAGEPRDQRALAVARTATDVDSDCLHLPHQNCDRNRQIASPA